MAGKKIRAVFFDVDDTLLSFSGSVRETMKSGFEFFGLPPYRESMFPVFDRINKGLWRQLEEGKMTFEELIAVRWDRIFAELDVSFDGKRFERYFRERLFDSAVLEPGAVETLERLRGKFTLCVASNGPCAQQLNRLRLGGLDGYFSHFFISERLGATKPDAGFFERAFAELRESGLDLLPEEALMVGDSRSSDIAGGKAFGMKTCLYAGAVEKEAECTGLADYVISGLGELAGILLPGTAENN